MELPKIITDLPEVDIPFPPDVVRTSAMASPHGLLIFFEFIKDMVLPPHSHGGQWGTVLDGEVEFTIGGETKIYRRGDSYDIPAGVEHGAKIPAGTKVIDFFEEADRYALRQSDDR